MLGLIGGLALGAANQALTVADTRYWQSLPKEFQYARLETPADGRLEIAVGDAKLPVELPVGSVKVVYVKVGASANETYISTFALKI
jgi:hypothetical protein